MSLLLFLLLILNFLAFVYTEKENKKLELENLRYFLLVDDYKQNIEYLKSELCLYQKQCRMIETNENILLCELNKIDIEKYEYNPVYKGKKAILGDYTCMCEYTRRVLIALGFEVDIVSSGEQIVERIRNNKYHYDIIFTNNTYKNSKYENEKSIQGIDVLNIIKQELHLTIPVVVVTVSDLCESQFLLYGFDGCIKKPATIARTKKVIENIFKNTK